MIAVIHHDPIEAGPAQPPPILVLQPAETVSAAPNVAASTLCSPVLPDLHLVNLANPPPAPPTPARSTIITGNMAPRFSQPPKKILTASVLEPGCLDSDAPPVRTWEASKEINDSDSDGEDVAANPFGISKPPKEKVVVLHPGIVEHMRANMRGRRKPLRKGLTVAQVELLKDDFLCGLDFWERTWCTQEVTMWPALEASRYAEANPTYGQADIDLAVKLLVPIDVAEDARVLAQTCWNVKPFPHTEENEVFNTRFSIVPLSISFNRRPP